MSTDMVKKFMTRLGVEMSLNILKVLVSYYSADSIAQTTLSERLKADNIRLKQQLGDVQQRSLHDKVSEAILNKLALYLQFTTS